MWQELFIGRMIAVGGHGYSRKLKVVILIICGFMVNALSYFYSFLTLFQSCGLAEAAKETLTQYLGL